MPWWRYTGFRASILRDKDGDPAIFFELPRAWLRLLVLGVLIVAWAVWAAALLGLLGLGPLG